MDYLKWSKVHRRVRFELTVSGVPQAAWDDLGDPPYPLDLEVISPYGDPQLISAIAQRYVVPDECAVPVPGASSANFIAMACAAPHGATVAIEHPIYQPMQRVAEFLNWTIVPLFRRPECNFAIDLSELQSTLARGAQAVVITNLHNPSGQYIEQVRMKELAELTDRTGARMVVDEVYLDSVHLNLGGPRWTAAHLGENVIALNSLTKVYGLSGLRIGWILANPQVADRAREIMDLLSANNAGPSMSLAIRGFERMEHLQNRFRKYYSDSVPIFRQWLANEPHLKGYENHGALFECLRLPPGVDSQKLNEHLVSRYDTQIVSGHFFDLPDHIRLTPCAVKPDELPEALSRISRGVSDLIS